MNKKKAFYSLPGLQLIIFKDLQFTRFINYNSSPGIQHTLLVSFRFISCNSLLIRDVGSSRSLQRSDWIFPTSVSAGKVKVAKNWVRSHMVSFQLSLIMSSTNLQNKRQNIIIMSSFWGNEWIWTCHHQLSSSKIWSFHSESCTCLLRIWVENCPEYFQNILKWWWKQILMWCTCRWGHPSKKCPEAVPFVDPLRLWQILLQRSASLHHLTTWPELHCQVGMLRQVFHDQNL